MSPREREGEWCGDGEGMEDSINIMNKEEHERRGGDISSKQQTGK